MNNRLQFLSLLAIAVLGTVSGFRAADGLVHEMLFVALVAAFFASDRCYWRTTKPSDALNRQ